MTPVNAKAFLDLFGDLDTHPQCEHGHADCSTTPGGPCLDDVIRDACNPVEDAPRPHA